MRLFPFLSTAKTGGGRAAGLSWKGSLNMKKQTVTLLLSLLVVLALLGLMIFLMVRFQSGEEQ